MPIRCQVLLTLTIALLAGRAWGHGFALIPDSSTAPTSFTIASESPFLDQDQLTAGPGNLFLDAFDGTANVDGSYPTDEGFATIVGPQPPHSAATFHILSPLYFSDGTGAAVPASSGTYLHIFDLFAGNSDGLHPGAATGDVSIDGASGLLSGFGVSLTDFHELEKYLYIAGGSSQVDGEYGFAFDVTATFANGTVTSGPLVDVFATDIGAGGGFATNASDAVQDAATAAIYSAVVPEPATLSWRCLVLRPAAVAYEDFRRERCMRFKLFLICAAALAMTAVVPGPRVRLAAR